MRARASAFLLLAAFTAVGRPASAWDAGWAIRNDADWHTYLDLMANATLSLTERPGDVHGLGGSLSGGVRYLDDDKIAHLTIASLSYSAIYRLDRGRYDSGSFPAIGLFDLSVQLRVLPALHLLYGVALARGGIRSHGSISGLAFHTGWALPLRGAQGENMREYQRSYLQLECLPLAGSFLTDLIQEGYYDNEAPVVQLYGEIGLAGRLLTRGGVLTADARLTFSYLHQHSYYFLLSLRWLSPSFLRRRVRVVLDAVYVWPGRPFLAHISDNAEQLLYDHHLKFSLGFSFRL